MRERRTGAVEVADTKTSPTDVVTEVDRASEDLIRARLLAARPDDAVLGEEAGSEAGSSGVRWIVDPIDGTVNFLYGLPQYAISIAAEVDGEVVAGVVLNAATGVEYAASLGGGATRDGAPIGVRLDGPAGPAAGDHRLQLRRHRADPPGAGDRPAAPRGPRHPPPRLVGPGRLLRGRRLADAYVEEGVHLWDHAAVRAHRPRGGRRPPC